MNDELTVPELRAEVQSRAGVNELSYSAFTKSTLNSVYAYLTGEFYIKPDHIHLSRSDDRADVLEAVARAAEIEDWLDDPVAQFNKDHIESLLEEMNERGDQREWSGENSEISDV